ncbi:AAA family ATPase [Spirochaetota bacterium]
MVKEELIKKSPVRILERGIEGGLKAGNIGVIASRKGIGKTSVLVQLALDKLMQGKKIIHVSFTTHTSYVISWYENIFAEVAKRKNLEDLSLIHDDLMKNRVIMNFNQEGVSTEQILKSLRAMIVDGGFEADAVIADGFDFARADPSHFAKVRSFASEMKLEFWYSCTMSGEEPLLDKKNIPVILRSFLDEITVLIVLEPKVEYIHFVVVKDHNRMNPEDLNIKLDSKTLLIAEA